MNCACRKYTRIIYGECKRTIYPERHAKNKKFVKKTQERQETQETHVANFYIPLFSFALKKE